MNDVVRKLKSYVESENREYSISFSHKDAEELLKYIYRLETQHYKLDNALDKACKELVRDNFCFKCLNFTRGTKQDNYSKKDWKEWCLDEND